MVVLQPSQLVEMHKDIAQKVAHHRAKHPVVRYHEVDHFDVPGDGAYSHPSKAKG